MKRRRKPPRGPRQLTLLGGDLVRFLGRSDWTLMFKETKDGQLIAMQGKLEEVYDALQEWADRCPNYYSAVIYHPSGAKHRTVR